MRSATERYPFLDVFPVFQSTHSLRSATGLFVGVTANLVVSIHALLAECDFYSSLFYSSAMSFQSTHSLRSATGLFVGVMANLVVSIHALLAECDGLFVGVMANPVVSIHALLAECDSGKDSMVPFRHCFNPRTPCGVRPSFGLKL